MNQTKVGIVGLGRIGGVHLDAWRKVNGVEIVGIADDHSGVRQKARELGLPAFRSIQEMLEKTAVDALSICTPPAAHLPMAVRALENGVSVLCEKPLTVNFRSTERMIRSAESSTAVLQMATKFRHVAEIRAAKQFVADGEIGEPVNFQIEFAGVADMTQRWNSNPTLSGGGVIIDNGSHALDLVNFVFGPIHSVQATQIKPMQTMPVEDQALVLVNAGNGVVGEIMLTWSMQPSSDFYLTIRGTKGTIAIGWKASFIKRQGEETVQIANGYDKNACHARMMSEFQKLASGHGEKWVSYEECLNTQSALDGCYKSIESGSWVAVEDFERKTLAA